MSQDGHVARKGDFSERAEALTDRLWAWMWWGGLPILAVFTIWFFGSTLPDSWNASRGVGTRGTFVALDEHCSWHRVGGRTCEWHGSFTALDGSLKVADADFATGPRMRSGDQVPALMGHNEGYVYRATGSHEWLLDLAMVAGALGFLLLWAMSVFVRLRYRTGLLEWSTDRWLARGDED